MSWPSHPPKICERQPRWNEFFNFEVSKYILQKKRNVKAFQNQSSMTEKSVWTRIIGKKKTKKKTIGIKIHLMFLTKYEYMSLWDDHIYMYVYADMYKFKSKLVEEKTCKS